MKQEQRSLEEIRAFVEGSEEVHFEAAHQGEMYRWVEDTLRTRGGRGW
jgi:hypothetical protein